MCPGQCQGRFLPSFRTRLSARAPLCVEASGIIQRGRCSQTETTDIQPHATQRSSLYSPDSQNSFQKMFPNVFHTSMSGAAPRPSFPFVPSKVEYGAWWTAQISQNEDASEHLYGGGTARRRYLRAHTTTRNTTKEPIKEMLARACRSRSKGLVARNLDFLDIVSSNATASVGEMQHTIASRSLFVSR